MREIYELLHAHMFDGAEGTASASGEAGADVEGSTPEVVYGKAEESETEGQVGSDMEDDSNEGEDLDAEFDELVKGKFKNQYDSRVQNTINRRFRNAENYQQTVSEYEDATELLYARYGLQPGDVKGLKNAIETDDGLYAAEAEREGMTAENYMQNLRLKADAERGRSIMEEARIQQEKQERFERWDAEAEELQEAFPSFDLNAELENGDFLDALDRVDSVKDAFYIAHMQDILSGAMEHSSKAATRKAVDNFKANANRPTENGMKRQPAVVRKSDPSKMTDEELREVAERARSGETIRF